MSPNNGILLNGILKPKLLNVAFASCSFINLDFLRPHAAHFYDSIVLPLLVFEAFGFVVSVLFFLLFFFHFKQYDNMFYNELCLTYENENCRIKLVPTSFIIRLLF